MSKPEALGGLSSSSSSSSGENGVVVASYNLLAPVYVRPIDKRLGTIQPFAAFDWVSSDDGDDEVLSWPRRRAALGARVRALCAASDVMCFFQEVEFDEGSLQPPAWLVEALGEDMRIACVPSYPDLRRGAERNARLLGAGKAVGTLLATRLEVAYSVALSPRALVVGLAGGWAVACCHLDARSESKRLETLERCLEVARFRSGPAAKLVVAGDMNDEFGENSRLEAALVSSPSPSSRESQSRLLGWPPVTRLGRVAEVGPTRAGYDHEKDSKEMTSWCLDHLLYSRETVEPVRVLATLDAESLRIGTPNRREPSDHAPVAAAFRPGTHQGDDKKPSSRVAARDRLDALTAAEAADLARTAAQLRDLEAAETDDDNTPPVSSRSSSSSSKPSRRRPSPAQVAALRARRKLKAECKARAVEGRRAFLAELRDADSEDAPSSLAWFEEHLLDRHGGPERAHLSFPKYRGGVPPGGVSFLAEVWARCDREVLGAASGCL